MAVGDVISNLQSVTTGSFLLIQPSAGVEWVIHNICYGDEAEIYFTDGTNDVLIDNAVEGGAKLGYVYHCTNSYYYKVKNTSAGAIYIGYDGVQTK